MSEFITSNPNSNNKLMSSQSLYDKFINIKREAYSNLDQALTFDSANTGANSSASKLDTAIIMYEKCLNLVDQAISFYQANSSQLSSFSDSNQIFLKLKSMKEQTNDRLNVLKTERVRISNLSTKNKTDFVNEEDFLVVGEEILNSNSLLIMDDLDNENDNSSTHNKINNSNSNSTINNDKTKLNDFTKANEILRLDDGVQLFYIANDGTVSTPSYPTSLSVYSFDPAKSNNDKNVVGFVRVGSWMYPLVPNESPGMKTNFNAYIFPNDDDEEQQINGASASAQQGPKFTFVGITFSDKIKNEDKLFFEDVLSNYSSLIYQEGSDKQATKPGVVQPASSLTTTSSSNSNLSQQRQKEKEQEANGTKESILKSDSNSDIPRSWSAERIAQQLVNGAQYISQGVSSTAEYANKYIKKGGDNIKKNVQPNSQPANIDPKLKSAAQGVRYGTHVSVKVSSFLLNKLTSLASSTAKAVAPHLKQGSTALLAKSGLVSDKTNANNYVENVCTVAHGSLQGFGLVYDSLEKAAKSLGKNLTEETVTVVDHKYGTDAAKLTQNSLYSVGNVALTVNNFKNLKIVRTFAKETAKETITSSSSKKNPNNNNNDNSTNENKTGNSDVKKSN